MRIRRLDLTRYGKFTGTSLDFGERPAEGGDLHVVYGLNEAGKSTALSATLDLLFGIEHKSEYGFLHPYPSMEIGAALEIDGALHDLVRLKRGAGHPSLFHADQSPASDAVIAGALSGIGREAFRNMFSLDDETLERGGDAILQSKGDLGELLFSASAGLAEIGAALAKTGEEADALHKKQARSTVIAGLKARLAELKTRREALDTAASAYAALSQTATRAGEAYRTGLAELGRVKADLEHATRLLKAAPVAADYRATAETLAAYAGLPRAPEAYGRDLPSLRDAEARLGALIEAGRERAGSLLQEIDALVPDEAVLSLAGEIRAMRDAMGRYATAEEDLPRRRASLAAHEARVAALLHRLGQGDHADPAALILPAPVTGRLRELIEARSGVDARLRTADEEFRRAGEAVEAAQRAAGRGTAESEADDPTASGQRPDRPEGEERALSNLAQALRRVRDSDAPVRLRLCQRERPQAERKLEQAMDKLAGFGVDAPFAADPKALAALVPPDETRVEAWRAALAELDRRRARHREKHRDLEAEAAAATARLEALRGAAGAIGDDEARRLRAARDAAWARHSDRLDPASAAVFAAALEADDRIVEARLTRARDLTELRQFEAALAVAEAGRAVQDAALAAVEVDVACLLAEMSDAVPPGIALPAPGRIGAFLDRLAAFALRRTEALAAAAALGAIVSGEAAARAEAQADGRALAQACRLCGAVGTMAGGEGDEAGETIPIAELAALAEDLIEERRAGSVKAAQATAALADSEAQLTRRREARREAAEALRRWQGDWSAALAGRWIDPDAGIGAVREILDVLGELAAALRERDEMGHRVETMLADQAALAERCDGLLRRLGETADETPPPRLVEALAARLDEAEKVAALLGDRRAEREAEEARTLALLEELRHAAARKEEMTALFGVETLAEVAEALERVAERARLERRLGELGRTLVADLQAAGVEDALARLAAADLGEAERAAGELAARQEDLETHARELFANQKRAAEALEAIGGGDEVARLQVERQTVLIEMEEAARRHLRLKAGALVAEEALRRFRDRHRSTMMGRASEAFAAMTRGAYSGLSARPDKDRETLIGLPREGGSKLATAMSKGTRFQLYLALRLAGYEEFASARRAVPFLADDIMETFDEPRSEEVLRRLAKLSRIGQVVYFTHHRHLCDIARLVEPGVRIHQL